VVLLLLMAVFYFLNDKLVVLMKIVAYT
jgi:hypothetical protein